MRITGGGFSVISLMALRPMLRCKRSITFSKKWRKTKENGTKDAIKMLLDNRVADWFKTIQLESLYKSLSGKEEQLTLNTPMAEFLKYSTNKNC